MAKLINKTQGFTIVSNGILKDKKINLKSRGLLTTLLSLPDAWEFSILGLTRILPDGKDAITSAVKDLEQLGYLNRIQSVKGDGKFNGYDWIINDTPKKEKPSAENPSTVNPSTEKPSAENTAQYNKQKEKTNIYNNNQSITQSHKETPENYWRVRRELEETIGYSMIEKDEIAKDIFEFCIEICITKEDAIRVGKKQVPTSLFQHRIKALYYEDILHIANSLRSVENPIINPRAYILSALYNEGNTSNLYWTNKVKADGVI